MIANKQILKRLKARFKTQNIYIIKKIDNIYYCNIKGKKVKIIINK
jgi:hypothetical protein